MAIEFSVDCRLLGRRITWATVRGIGHHLVQCPMAFSDACFTKWGMVEATGGMSQLAVECPQSCWCRVPLMDNQISSSWLTAHLSRV